MCARCIFLSLLGLAKWSENKPVQLVYTLIPDRL